MILHLEHIYHLLCTGNIYKPPPNSKNELILFASNSYLCTKYFLVHNGKLHLDLSYCINLTNFCIQYLNSLLLNLGTILLQRSTDNLYKNLIFFLVFHYVLKNT